MSLFLAMHDFVDCTGADAELARERALGYAAASVLHPDADNVLARQPGIVTALTARGICWADMRFAAFVHLVDSVVGMRAEKQMVRSNAGAIVAMMTDEQTIRDRPEMQFPREAMGLDSRVFDEKLPISAATGTKAIVNPAMRGLLYVAPEPLFRCPQPTSVGAGATAKARSAGSVMNRIRMVCSAALAANCSEFWHKQTLTQIAHGRQA